MCHAFVHSKVLHGWEESADPRPYTHKISSYGIEQGFSNQVRRRGKLCRSVLLGFNWFFGRFTFLQKEVAKISNYTN